MQLNQHEIEELTKHLDQINASKASPKEKIAVTPGVVIAMVLTTLSGLCLTKDQKNAVDAYRKAVGDLPVNASIEELLAARKKVVSSKV